MISVQRNWAASTVPGPSSTPQWNQDITFARNTFYVTHEAGKLSLYPFLGVTGTVRIYATMFCHQWSDAAAALSVTPGIRWSGWLEPATENVPQYYTHGPDPKLNPAINAIKAYVKCKLLETAPEGVEDPRYNRFWNQWLEGLPLLLETNLDYDTNVETVLNYSGLP